MKFLIFKLKNGHYWYWNRDAWTWIHAEYNATQFTQQERETLSLPEGGSWIKMRS